MKYKIIKNDNYLFIIDDSEIKEGNIVLYKNQPCIFTQQIDANGVRLFKYLNSGGIGMGEDWEGQKIIAHLSLNNAPEIEGVDLLPPIEDEVEKLAIQEVGIDNSIYNISDHESFIKGYNKAKEKYKYTKEDIINFVEWIAYTKKHGSVKPLQEAFIQYKISSTKELFEIYQYLQQPKMPVEFEREIEVGCIDNGKEINQYKVSYNSQGITQWVGKYIY